jgi:hypothetical protein
MSYSFTVQGVHKDEVKAKVELEVLKIVAQQSIHARDQAAICATAAAFIDLLEDDPAKDIELRANGSLSWMTGDMISYASVSVTAMHVNRKG